MHQVFLRRRVNTHSSKLFMATDSTGQAIIFCSCGFYLLLSSFFPRLFTAVGNWILLHTYHTSTHDVALVQI